MTTKRLFEFPNPVNEVSARLVAGGVVTMCLAFLVLGQRWVLIPLTYGFIARVLTGPTLSPLGSLVTAVVTPRLGLPVRETPGPPKRFAQGIGATLATAASIAYYGFGSTTGSAVLVSMIAVAASLEAFVGYCLGCRIFALLMARGVISEGICEACADLSKRQTPVPS